MNKELCNVCNLAFDNYLIITKKNMKSIYICEKCYTTKYYEFLNMIKKSSAMINVFLKSEQKESLKELIIKLKP